MKIAKSHRFQDVQLDNLLNDIINALNKTIQSSRLLLTTANITTSLTTWVDVTGATIIMKTDANKVLIVVSGAWSSDASAQTNYIDIDIDGQRQGGTSGLHGFTAGGGGYWANLSFTYLTAPLTATSHTFKLVWKRDTAAVGTIFASTTAPLHFAVIELTG